MNDSQLAQLKAMSPAGRISHYLKKKLSGQITAEQYEECVKFALSLEDTTTHEEGSKVGTDSRQADDVRELEQAGSTALDQYGERCEKVEQTFEKGQPLTPLEFVNSLSFPVAPDGAVREGRSETVDTGKSQKDRLLTLLADYNWHSTPSIQIAVYGANHLGIARVAARVNDLKNDGHDIESRKITQAIWEYRLVEKGMRWISENINSG